MDKFFKIPSMPSTSGVTSANEPKKKKNGKYDESYLKFGFSVIDDKPQCVICFEVLSRESFKPSKLQRHLTTEHKNFKDKPLEFFERKLKELQQQQSNLVQMSGAETSNEPTILDYLIYDCWQAILEYVPVNDIIRSEPVSKKWQRVVLVYLQRVRIGIKVESPLHDISKFHRDVCWLKLREADCSSFKSWASKLGPSVVAFCCDTKQRWKIFGKNCPNLAVGMFIDLPEKLLLNTQYENFKCLQWICFEKLWKVSDRGISPYIASGALKGVEILGSGKLTGQCLASITSTKLTYLFIQQCKHLSFKNLLAAADRLSELTKFKLMDVSNEIYNNIHVLLGKMPKLDHLHIYVLTYNCREPIKNDHFFESVCRLANLKHLGVDFDATDGDLEAVTRCCKELRSLLLEKCEDVTGRGVAAACKHAGARLTALGIVHSRHLTDDDVMACILACPNLTDLDVRNCPRLTEELLARARAARRPLRARTTLRLYVNDSRLMRVHFDRVQNHFNTGEESSHLRRQI